AECLQECHLAREAFQLNACFPPPLGQEVREKSDGAESENRQADDVLQRHQLRPRSRRGWYDTEVREIHMREVNQRTCSRRQESAATIEQNARHDDLKKIERGKIAVDSPGSVDRPRDKQQVNSDLRIRLPHVRRIGADDK